MVRLMETLVWHANCGSSIFTSVVHHLRDHGTLKPQTHDRTERILQAEEQILERVEEKPDISTR